MAFGPRFLELIESQVDGFDWDAGNREKCAAHGVSHATTEEVFVDHDILIAPDAAHSSTERRLYAIGRDRAGRFVLVVFTLRRQRRLVLVRPISVRYMHAREVARFGEEEAPRAPL